jgi:hypothetical protein
MAWFLPSVKRFLYSLLEQNPIGRVGERIKWASLSNSVRSSRRSAMCPFRQSDFRFAQVRLIEIAVNGSRHARIGLGWAANLMSDVLANALIVCFCEYIAESDH